MSTQKWHRDWSKVSWLLDAEALPAARRLADIGSPDCRAETHLVLALLEALQAAGMRVSMPYEALGDALEADRTRSASLCL